MEPVFTIPYPEFAVAQQLSAILTGKEGFSIFVPTSRQQKGVDLLVTHRKAGVTKAMSIQVKSSRTYSHKSMAARTRRKFRYATWYNTFQAPPEAEFVFLIALYPNERRQGERSISSWWDQLVLVFSHDEMASFLKDVRTQSGNPDKMFAFGFDDPEAIFQTRGDEEKGYRDFSKHLLKNRVSDLQRFFHDAPTVAHR